MTAARDTFDLAAERQDDGTSKATVTEQMPDLDADARQLADVPKGLRARWAKLEAGWPRDRFRAARARLEIVEYEQAKAREKAKAFPDDEHAPRVRVDGASWMRADHVEIARHALAELQGGGPELVFADNALHRYDPDRGIWISLERSEVSRTIQEFSGVHVETDGSPLHLRAGDISGAMSVAHDRVTRPDFFADAPSGIAFADAFVRVSGEGFAVERNAPEQRARYAYPFAWADTRASRPWLEFLAALFDGDDDREERIALMAEFFGASLLGLAPRYQRCLMIRADGGAGRSTLMEIIRACFPPGSVVAIPAQDFGEDYKRALLAGRRLNMVAELPESEILNSEPFKAVVTGDQMTARHPAGRAFSFRPIAGHVFAANRLPGTSDHTLGFWSRMIVLEFRRKFRTDGSGRTNAAEDVLREGRPAIVRWMLEGARRLMAQGAYTIPSSHATALAQWQREANPVQIFLEERTRPLNGEQAPLVAGVRQPKGVPAAELYRAFKSWMLDNGHKPLSSTRFGIRMRELGLPAVPDGTARRHPLLLVERAPEST